MAIWSERDSSPDDGAEVSSPDGEGDGDDDGVVPMETLLELLVPVVAAVFAGPLLLLPLPLLDLVGNGVVVACSPGE
jgi:hypothetical protein